MVSPSLEVLPPVTVVTNGSVMAVSVGELRGGMTVGAPSWLKSPSGGRLNSGEATGHCLYDRGGALR